MPGTLHLGLETVHENAPNNVFDAIVVFFSCLDGFVMQPLKIKAVNVSVLRLLRLTRVFKFTKFLRFSENLSDLRILIKTLSHALPGIFWSMVLLWGIITAGGILMAQLAINFLDDESIDVDRRIWLYKGFGTTFASIFTMFECSFTGSWMRGRC